MKIRLLLAVLVGILSIMASPTDAHAGSCPATVNLYTLPCVGVQPGLPSGYDNPPQHQPTRCVIEGVVTETNDDGTLVLDAEGNAVKTHYTEMVATGKNVFLDTQPTGTPESPNTPIGGGESAVESWKTQIPNVVVTNRPEHHLYRLFETRCKIPGDNSDFQPNSEKLGWVRIVSVENLVDDLLVRVIARMSDVALTWPTVSPTHGWQMVKVPLEVRGEVPATVTDSMSASNWSGTLSISITATPSHVVFFSGDNDVPVVCPVAALSWPVPVPEQPSSCSYAYRHSSVQRQGQPFKTQTITVWNLQTPDPTMNGAWPLPPVTTDLLVAETQALVTG